MSNEQFSFEQEQAIDIYKIYDRFKDEEPFYTGACLAGLDTKEAWGLRSYLSEQSKDARRGVVQGLAGLTSNDSYEMRKAFLREAPESAARSLAGDDSETAWELREEIKKHLGEPGVANGLAESLACMDTPRSWELRKELLQDEKVVSSILEGLAGVDSEEAWKLREQYVDEYPVFVAESLCTLYSERAMTMRNTIVNIDEPAVLGSYVGSNEEIAWDLRKRNFKINPFLVGTSLAGLVNDHADMMRRALLLKLEGDYEEEEKHKIRKGILQGLNSNYIFEAIKKIA